jgi:hypothetical protein
MLLEIATKKDVIWKQDSFWAAVTTWELLPFSLFTHPILSNKDKTSRQPRKQEETDMDTFVG